MLNLIGKQAVEQAGTQLADKLRNTRLSRPITLMEVCGTHTHSIFKSGLRSLLPPDLKLLSGPGCPVCVTPQGYIDLALELAGYKDTIIASFGDMLKVPGHSGSLQQSRAEGADIRVVYSPMESLRIAEENPLKNVIFLAVGFETTVPTVAAVIERAAEAGVKNLTFLTAHKVVPNALRALLADPDISLDGFLLPGHVSTITGYAAFDFLKEEYRIPAVIAGFEPAEMLSGLLAFIAMKEEDIVSVINLYGGLVTREGNRKAQALLDRLFDLEDSVWRGLGTIPQSGLRLKGEFASYDTREVYGVKESDSSGPSGCRCGEILKGKTTPLQCPLFGKACNPEHPVGPCMVSSEGTCSAYYKYHC